MIRFFLRKALLDGHLQAILAGSFFLSCGWLMERNGMQEFSFADKHGRTQARVAVFPGRFLYCRSIRAVPCFFEWMS